MSLLKVKPSSKTATKGVTTTKTKPFNWDQCPTRVSLVLEKCRYQFVTIDRTLQQMRTKRTIEHIKLDEQWLQLYADEEQFRRYFLRSGRFLKDNDVKKKRSQERISTAQDTFHKYHLEVTEAQMKLDMYKRAQYDFDEKLRQYRRYEDFLEAVLRLGKLSHCNNSITGLITRYEVLVDTKRDLTHLEFSIGEQYRDHKTQLVKLRDTFHDTISNLNYKLSNLRERSQTVHRRVLQWEQILTMVRLKIQRIWLELCRCGTATEQNHLLLRQRRSNGTTTVTNDLYTQILELNQAMQQLKRIGDNSTT